MSTFGPRSAIIAMVALSGCERSHGPPDLLEGVTRDSAGVEIVEYQSLPQRLVQWRLADNPDVDIGTGEGDANAAFGYVSGFAEGPNAEIVVADGQAQEVRAFDQNGSYLWTAGREGRGPGEFTSLTSVFWMGDSLAGVNHFSRTVALFGPTGEFRRTVKLGSPSRAGYGSPIVRGVLPTGHLVITAAQEFNPAGALGYRRDQFVLQLYGPDGTPRADLGLFPDMELVIEDMQGQAVARPVRMGRSTVVAARDRTIVAATTDRFEYRRFDLSGTLVQIVRVAFGPQRVNSAIRSRYVAHALSQIDETDRDAARAGIESTALPEVLPALDGVQIDPDGNVWLKQFVMPDEARSAKWWVFTTDGDMIASADIPSDLTQIRVGREHVIGLAFDTMQVAHIQTYRLDRQ